jgi:aryl-alcohol dehydrogenase-like predicted oxidoreductase
MSHLSQPGIFRAHAECSASSQSTVSLLKVTCLGAGLAEIRFRRTLADGARAARVLNTALHGGSSFLDTAACCGASKELIGRTIARRGQIYVNLRAKKEKLRG